MSNAARPGIIAAGTAFGTPQAVADTAAAYVPDPEAVGRLGYTTYHRVADGVTATDLAAGAAREALENADLDIADIDLIVVGHSDVPEYLGWDPSAAVARALGAGSTPTVLFTQACAAWAPALDHVAGAMALDPGTETALLILVNVHSEAHSNRMDFNGCIASDGAVAVVLRRGYPRLCRLSSAQVTNPEYADLFRIEYGGSAVPVPPAGSTHRDLDPMVSVYRHFDRDPARFQAFLKENTTRLADVVDAALARAGRDRAELARLVYLNDNQQTFRAVADTVGLPLERTNARQARELGHMGAADQLVCLWRHLESGELAKGDLVALAGAASPGMHWFCTLLEV
ncbi:3-oxoacyl-(ACP) synthase III [Streptomyces davaonensis JCM 4913]|uniref:3-oxoacyl-(ACP) synthase III n=1 Tax=Streptomyces davaonensis (strain DSM 101723 / JCM 4913 / KCC S-0913 / 768) TaxID=1214101 RepID=K4RB16_STRDJ|nr:3-oxoacyl-[acyl-carrier-protein] synthase III C-terminal domain-containing protein [Streptomyces davaonensis]CCK30437.1 3-oxoacyl-(ACP) synthase III [Streptomyces davaonensis JCM 4913]